MTYLFKQVHLCLFKSPCCKSFEMFLVDVHGYAENKHLSALLNAVTSHNRAFITFVLLRLRMLLLLLFVVRVVFLNFRFCSCLHLDDFGRCLAVNIFTSPLPFFLMTQFQNKLPAMEIVALEFLDSDLCIRFECAIYVRNNRKRTTINKNMQFQKTLTISRSQNPFQRHYQTQ